MIATDLGADPLHRHRLLAGNRHGRRDQDQPSPSAPSCRTCPSCRPAGAYAGLIGRSTALLAGLAVDLQPAGWRLTDGSGRDHRRAINTLRSDLDLLEEHAQGYAGPLKYAVAGPWTLAATMERPRGDRVLADYGARRDLAQSLAEGVADLIVEMRPTAAGGRSRSSSSTSRCCPACWPAPCPRPAGSPGTDRSTSPRSATPSPRRSTGCARHAEVLCTAAPPIRRSPCSRGRRSAASWSISTS